MTFLLKPVWAPFTPEQVASLSGYQASGKFSPYTCSYDDCRGSGEGEVLTVSEGGLRCPACHRGMGYAHEPTVDGSWRELEDVTVTVGGLPVKGEIGVTVS